MTVNIQSERGGCVSDVLLYRFDIVAVLQGDHCVCVPQIMKASARSADRCDDFLEILVYGSCT